MKTSIGFALLMIASLALTGHAFAQQGPGGPNREKIEAQKVAYITTKLNLTTEEAQKFWPVYNEYQTKQKDLMKGPDDKPSNLSREEMMVLPEKEAARLADEELLHAQKMLDLRKEYHAKFKSVLSSQKVLLLYEAEKDFRRELLHQLRGQGPGGKKGGGGYGPGDGSGGPHGYGPGDGSCIYR
jgi:hypothetical protein